jgi:hypothetical protein
VMERASKRQAVETLEKHGTCAVLAHPPRAEHFDEVLHGASIFSPLTTTATFDNRINYRPPTQWLVDPPPLLVMDLDHACYAVFGRPSMRYANLRPLDDPHEHLEFCIVGLADISNQRHSNVITNTRARRSRPRLDQDNSNKPASIHHTGQERELGDS